MSVMEEMAEWIKYDSCCSRGMFDKMRDHINDKNYESPEAGPRFDSFSKGSAIETRGVIDSHQYGEGVHNSVR